MMRVSERLFCLNPDKDFILLTKILRMEHKSVNKFKKIPENDKYTHRFLNAKI